MGYLEYVYWITLLAYLVNLTEVSGIGCYMCTSHNGTDPGCHDPFNPALSNFEDDCRQGKIDRFGYFPAHYCIKIKGTEVGNTREMYIRTCSIETLEDQCGEFQFEGVLYNGCISTCKTTACNKTPKSDTSLGLIIFLHFFIAYYVMDVWSFKVASELKLWQQGWSN